MSLSRCAAAADEVAQAAVRLDRFVLLSYAGFVKIAKKHDRLTGLCTRPWLLSRLASGELMRARFDTVVTSLSDAYAAVRARRAGGAPDGGEAWVPPSDFERATTKYWLAPEDVLAVKVTLVKHLPVLIFGRPSSVPLDAAQDVPSDSSVISSVYLDSAALDVYRTRLEREEGSTLIRVRWYGDAAGDSSPDAELFVERKTHHESWTTDGSVKERCVGAVLLRRRGADAAPRRSFRLKGRHVGSLLRGELDIEAQLAKLRAGGASEADVARTRQLATEVADEVAKRRLAPALRTVYFRTAFQLSSSNAVRVSLDTQLRMVDERDVPHPPAAWCRRLDTATPLAARECVDFPFAVLEVKLQDAVPEWVESLLASGRLISCYKFSKFLHGTAALRHAEVPKLPHWWDDAAVGQPAAPPPPAAAEAAVAAPPELSAAGRSLNGTRELSQCSMGVAENGSSDDLPALRPRAGQLARTMSAPPVASLETVIAMPDQRITRPLPRRSSFTVVKERLQSLRAGGDGGDAGPPAPAPAPASTILTAPLTKRHVPIKVEPKTFFANERTMLQWLNMATLILFTSLALTSYNDPLTRNKTLADGSLDYSSQLAGAVLAPVAIVFIVYALYTYLWRARRIARREPSARYDDRFGPTVLVLLLLVVTTTSIVLTIAHADWHKHGMAPVPPAATRGGGLAGAQQSSLLVFRGQEMKPGTHAAASSAAALGIMDAAAAAGSRACGELPVTFPPYFRPRGAVLAAGGDALLLGGAYELLLVPLPNASAGLQPRSLAAPGWDMLSLVRGLDGAITLLAASGPGVEFATLNEVSGAVTPAEGPGGAAAAASAIGSGAGGAVLVATSGGIEVMQRSNASAAVGEAWRAVRRLPADALAAQLSDGHVSALSYDAAADALLMLFDRAAPPLLRALRLRTGEVISDWALPGGGGLWSGMALAADGTAYLTRASPPQLWRFARRADGAVDCGAQA